MYHYRWHYARDASHASVLLPCWTNEDFLGGSDEELSATSKVIGDRQIGRLSVVGSSSKTKPLIEDSYIQFLRAFQAHLTAGYIFLLGDRPCAADFAIFGQLSQLVNIDPTSATICETIAPRVVAW